MSRARKIPKVAVGTPVIVHWFDAHQDASFHGDAAELKDTNAELKDIGFWVGQNRRYVTIAVEKGYPTETDFRHMHAIPKVNVIAIKVLDEPAYATTNSVRANDKVLPLTKSVGSDGDGVLGGE